ATACAKTGPVQAARKARSAAIAWCLTHDVGHGNASRNMPRRRNGARTLGFKRQGNAFQNIGAIFPRLAVASRDAGLSRTA
ncbi:MAG TPA: hypothetical protein VGJ20_08140, partial [Xanthobacteraceae bacterium]